jgi:hypothetical protein
MIMDRTALFSDRQAITADAASTNIIDLSATGTPYGASSPLVRDIGFGRAIPLVVTVTQTFNNLTNMVIQVQTDDNSSFTSPKIVFTSPTYTLAQLAAGAEYLLPDAIPAGVNERYLRIYYDITGTAPSAGTITAGVVMDRQSKGVY